MRVFISGVTNIVMNEHIKQTILTEQKRFVELKRFSYETLIH